MRQVSNVEFRFKGAPPGRRCWDCLRRNAAAGRRSIAHELPERHDLGTGAVGNYHFIHRATLEFKAAFVDFKYATWGYPVEFRFDFNR